LTFCLLQPADAFLKDLEIMVRKLAAGAVAASREASHREKNVRRNPGDRE
jgi:hypothetical protein